MRLVIVASLAALTATAGCSGKDNEKTELQVRTFSECVATLDAVASIYSDPAAVSRLVDQSSKLKRKAEELEKTLPAPEGSESRVSKAIRETKESLDRQGKEGTPNFNENLAKNAEQCAGLET